MIAIISWWVAQHHLLDMCEGLGRSSCFSPSRATGNDNGPDHYDEGREESRNRVSTTLSPSGEEV